MCAHLLGMRFKAAHHPQARVCQRQHRLEQCAQAVRLPCACMHACGVPRAGDELRVLTGGGGGCLCTRFLLTTLPCSMVNAYKAKAGAADTLVVQTEQTADDPYSASPGSVLQRADQKERASRGRTRTSHTHTPAHTRDMPIAIPTFHAPCQTAR